MDPGIEFQNNKEVFVSWIQQTASDDTVTATVSWRNLYDHLAVNHSDLTKRWALENGFIDAVVRELEHQPFREQVALLPLKLIGWFTFIPRYSAQFVAHPEFLSCLVRKAKENLPNEFGRACFNNFKSFAFQEDAREACLQAGGLDLVFPNFDFMDDPDECKDMAICSAQLICRLISTDEEDDPSCPANEVLRNHPRMILCLHWALKTILSNEDQAFLGSIWMPVGLVSDVSRLSLLPQYRKMLFPFIEQMLILIQTRREDVRALNKAVFFLVQLIEEPECRVYFENSKLQLVEALNQLMTLDRSRLDSDTIVNISMLQSVLQEAPKPRKAIASQVGL